jgi:alkanesulfonate monooxygenase SsuD/methylene tetrahydromethanopterin reductase-like flavin-dependent oxidoreductase (luciferase family)
VRGEVVDFEGSYYHTDACELLPRSVNPHGGPPLMVGTMGSRMLQITLPHVEQWNAWFGWFDNRVDRLGELLRQVDATCEDVGRDPSTLERTAAILVQAPGGTGRTVGDEDMSDAEPVSGSPAAVAESLVAFADAGIGHAQIVLDPITLDALEWFAEVIEQLDA